MKEPEEIKIKSEMDDLKLRKELLKNERAKYSFWSFIWMCWYAYREQDKLHNYVDSEILSDCERGSKILGLKPSPELRNRFGLRRGNYNLTVWAILEQYFKSV